MACTSGDAFTRLFCRVDELSQNFVQQTYQAIAADIRPIVIAMLGIAIAWYGWQVAAGRGNLSAYEIVSRIARAAFVALFALSWSEGFKIIYDAVIAIPDGLGKTVIQALGQSGGAGGTGGQTAASVENGITQVYQTVNETYRAIAARGTGWSSAVIMGFLALVVWIIGAIFCAVCAVPIIMAKIGLAILLGVAPVLIALAIFQYASQFFDGWVRALVQVIFVQVFVYAYLAFFLTLIKDVVANLARANAGLETAITEIGPAVVLFIVGILSVPAIASMASVIAGGSVLTAYTMALHRPPAAMIGVGRTTRDLGIRGGGAAMRGVGRGVSFVGGAIWRGVSGRGSARGPAVGATARQAEANLSRTG
jgi:type IV secretion system protein VirB6